MKIVESRTNTNDIEELMQALAKQAGYAGYMAASTYFLKNEMSSTNEEDTKLILAILDMFQDNYTIMTGIKFKLIDLQNKEKNPEVLSRVEHILQSNNENLF